MLNWKEAYAIGEETIDQQHQQLFAIGNKIYDLLENYLLADKYDRIAAIIDELKDYTRYHFQWEEEFMLKTKNPLYLSQKAEHMEFIDKIDSVDFDKVDENQDQFIRELLVFVFDWIESHILKSDKKILETGTVSIE
ncbi:hemerythrin family protein [Dehalobacter sp. DCM]|uniref:bacteriohemerythrin n=1 Tax=Dehalobacter sp. DCM TaxID=2907827 RepID=UPI0030820C34|nr:hemerythrin family protein [Dehalobacter sp. DCM]